MFDIGYTILLQITRNHVCAIREKGEKLHGDISTTFVKRNTRETSCFIRQKRLSFSTGIEIYYNISAMTHRAYRVSHFNRAPQVFKKKKQDIIKKSLIF